MDFFLAKLHVQNRVEANLILYIDTFSFQILEFGDFIFIPAVIFAPSLFCGKHKKPVHAHIQKPL